MGPFHVLIFTSAEPSRIKQLLKHLGDALPQVKLSLLSADPCLSPAAESQVRQSLEFLSSQGPIRSAVVGLVMRIRGAFIGILDCLLRWVHAAPNYPNAGTLTLDELRAYAESKGVQFLIMEGSRPRTSADLVRRIEPDLGVVFGARTRDMDLFRVPRMGSIILHSDEYDDDRGANTPGPRSVRGGRAEQTVSVYRVSGGADSQALLGERAFAIQEYDTLESIAVKSNLLGIECLVDVIRSESRGCTGVPPQGSPGSACEEGWCHHRALQEDGAIRRNHHRFRPKYGRPLVKLLARFLFYPRVWLSNRRRAANQSFPVVILFGHVVADRPKFMGISTDQFLRQVKFLKKHYKIASLPEAIEMIREGRVPAPTVVLTFDDGYQDNHLGLRAVIDSEEIAVTLFVCTRNVEEHRPFDHDLKRGESGFFPLTWDQVKEFERRGSTIGSHTRTHFDCGSRDEGLLREEIVGAQEDLRRHLGHEVPYFSFPWGYPKNMSPAALQIASQTYQYLFAAYGGINEIRTEASPVFKRVSWPESLLELELSLQGILDFQSYDGIDSDPGRIASLSQGTLSQMEPGSKEYSGFIHAND